MSAKNIFFRNALNIIGLCSFSFILCSCDQDNGSPPRTDLLENTQFHNIPENKKDVARSAIASLLKICPNIEKYSTHGENLKVYYYENGWERTAAHLDVELDLDPVSLKALPQGLRDPQWGGHMELGLSGGKEPGAIMEMPLPLWLCGLPVDDNILSSVKRDWVQQKQFLAIPEITANSF